MKKISLLIILLSFMLTYRASAHCDSYDGPVIKDALKALEINNVNLVLKWISSEQEREITDLFSTVYSLRNGNKEIYNLAEKHFLETLVRLHRETENAPYTGLKEAGHVEPIIKMSDNALQNGDPEQLLSALTQHINAVLKEKYLKVDELMQVKEESVVKGREYVDAYVDFVHTVEAFHEIIEGKHQRH